MSKLYIFFLLQPSSVVWLRLKCAFGTNSNWLIHSLTHTVYSHSESRRIRHSNLSAQMHRAQLTDSQWDSSGSVLGYSPVLWLELH